MGGRTGLNDRDAAGCVVVVVGLVVAAAAIVLAVTLLPVAGVAAAAWLVLQRRAVFGAVLAAASVALGFWLWPLEYAYVRYYEEVPDVTGVTRSADDATDDLILAGFMEVRVERRGDQGRDVYCWVDGQRPEAGDQADTRDPVTLILECSGPG